jgi:hypothetical protein
MNKTGKLGLSSPTTDVIFTNTQTRNKVEVIYKSGRLEINR